MAQLFSEIQISACLNHTAFTFTSNTHGNCYYYSPESGCHPCRACSGTQTSPNFRLTHRLHSAV